MARPIIHKLLLLLCLLVCSHSLLFAQDERAASQQPTPSQSTSDKSMPEMDMDKSPDPFLDQILVHNSSGTSLEPASIPEPMLMTTKGKWMFMFHGVAFLTKQL